MRLVCQTNLMKYHTLFDIFEICRLLQFIGGALGVNYTSNIPDKKEMHHYDFPIKISF